LQVSVSAGVDVTAEHAGADQCDLNCLFHLPASEQILPRSVCTRPGGRNAKSARSRRRKEAEARIAKVRLLTSAATDWSAIFGCGYGKP
jgi:hypothetical protein